MIYERKQIQRLVDKMRALEIPYLSLLFEDVSRLQCTRFDTESHYRQVPQDVRWHAINEGERWGGPFQTMWLKTHFHVPEEFAGRTLALLSGINAFECMVFINGEPTGLFNKDGDELGGNHSISIITKNAQEDSEYEIAIECYAGTPCLGTFPYDHYGQSEMDDQDFVHTFQFLKVCAIREDVSEFLFNLRTINQLVEVLDKKNGRYGELLAALIETFSEVCQYPVDVPEATWRQAMQKANAVLAKALSVKNGSQSGYVGLVGHSHMDTAWLWTVEETKRKCARTYANALSLMDIYPDYTFIQSSALHSSWMRDYYPAIFAKMKTRVAEGRYEPNGAVWVECDCNITGGEALIRQFLFGQLFTQEAFDYTSDTFWLPDTFGYNMAIPQIMKGTDVKYFLTTKMEWNESNKFPYDSFVWRGMDGSEILVHLNRSHVWPDVKTIVSNFNDLSDKHVNRSKLVSYGFGDGGGGPQYQMLEMSKRIADLNGCPVTEHTSVSKFMQKLEGIQDELPVWDGELYLELHRGTLTMMHNIKRSNRKAEVAIRELEMLSVFAHLEAGYEIDRERLKSWWKILLKNQFHDILPGTCIPEVNEEVIPQNYRLVDEVNDCCREILSEISGDQQAVTFFNSLSWPRNDQVVIVYDGDVEDTSTQRIIDVSGRSLLAVSVELPAMAAKSYSLSDSAKQSSFSSETDKPFCFHDNVLDTPFATITFDQNGAISSYFDKGSDRELRRPDGAPLNTFYMAEDVPFIYDNWDIDSDITLKMQPRMNLESRRIICDGPLQLRVESRYAIGEKSQVKQHMVFYSNTPRIDFETEIEWHERHQLLKVGFDVNILSPVIRNEIQFGYAERPTHSNTSWDAAKNEVCNHKWTDISENRFGIAILNDCKYGISCDRSDIRLTLLKSGCRPDPSCDEGTHYFTYSMLPHEGCFDAENVVRSAYELNIHPTYAFGTVKTTHPICRVNAPNIIVETVKPSEHSDGYVIRLYECERSANPRVQIALGHDPREVFETNMLEKPTKKLTLRDSVVEVSFRAFEIKTLLVK